MILELIYNPIAGKGRSKTTLQRMEAELRRRDIAYHVSHTNGAGHATALTHQALERGCTHVAVLGGDGLVSEVCAAMRDNQAALLLVPCGTGNDFIKTMKLPHDPLKALMLQLDTPTRRIDCGTVNEHTFLNVAGVGFDTEALAQTARLKTRFRGLLPYLMGLFLGLKNYTPFEAEVTIDGVCERRPYTILSVANGRFFGGGMKVAPNADPQDGLFDVMLVDAMPKWKLFMLVPLFIPGWHTNLRVTRRVQAKEVLIKADAPFMVDLDGELKPVREAHFVCRQGSVTVCCP